MNRKYVLGGIVAAAVLAGGGIGLDAALPGHGGQTGTAYGAPSAPAAPATTGVGTAALPPGTALVDTNGRTLYLYEADTTSTSTCNGPCAQVWAPLLSHGDPPTVSGAARAALLGTSLRADGTRQVTYNGHPLYYFAGDRAPGDARGQGLNQFGGGWYVLTPDGNKIDSDDGSPSPASAAPAPMPTGNGYGY